MKKHLSLVIMMLAVIASACNPGQPAPSSIPEPTATYTPVPTNTATASPVPTSMFTPSPTPDPEKVWDYVALGDSNPTGYGVTGHSYVPIYAEFIAKDLGVEVQVHNRAFNGATSDQLLERLQTNHELQQDIRNAEIITIDIGGNDWEMPTYAYQADRCGGADNQDCLRALVQTYRENFDAILNAIDDLQGDRPKILIRTVDLYISNCLINIFDDSDLFNDMKPYIDEFNAYIGQATQAHNGNVVPLYLTFNSPDGRQNAVEYLQEDQCHLNLKGHQKVADMLRELGYEK